MDRIQKLAAASPTRAMGRAAQRGMTLIEIMAVVVILGLIATAVAVNVMGRLEEARVNRAKTDLHTLGECLDFYKMDKGRYPTTEEGLKAVVASGKCKSNIQDPWGKEYIYLYPGQVHPEAFDIKTYGADGQPGGQGEAADIVNQ